MLNASLVNPNYCSASIAPILPNADFPIPNQVIGSATYFTCNPGYFSSGNDEIPYYSCLSQSFTSGVWSDVTHTCIGQYSHFQLYCYYCIRIFHCFGAI